eukprot:scaffold1469_cov119-Cylindrotheca_fusiformis.AAC.22
MQFTNIASSLLRHRHMNSKTMESNRRFAYLLERLERIGGAVSADEAEEPMHNFTSELLQLKHVQKREAIVFKKGEEKLLSDLEQYGAIPIILNSIERFNAHGSPEFHNSACIALVHFAFQSRERSRQIYQHGGFHCIVQMMQAYRSVDYIQIIAVAALMVIGKNVGIEMFDLESTILAEIVSAMEYHQESAQLYIVACSALGTLFGPGSRSMIPQSEEEIEVYHRAIDAICYGLVILHLDDHIAQNLGKNLLFCMVGPKAAEEMMFYVESSYGVYAAAAA